MKFVHGSRLLSRRGSLIYRIFRREKRTIRRDASRSRSWESRTSRQWRQGSRRRCMRLGGRHIVQGGFIRDEMGEVGSFEVVSLGMKQFPWVWILVTVDSPRLLNPYF